MKMADEMRPDPDFLLSALPYISNGEDHHHRGKLKIFFGACAGVGKTCTMLEAAQNKKKQGIDVIIGLVETHKRQETEALLEGLEVLPRKNIDYKGVTLKEFDLDAALARKPSLIIVDELAHTNAPGCRHMKRWQDIAELLAAGIDVYTALNTQHLESLNDSIAKITSVIVRETVPDEFFNQADEVVLVDLPVSELLQRLKEGKVYLGESAERARENFFQEGTLSALREIALRKTAQRVDSQLNQYRTLHAVKKIWQAGERLLVCIGPSPFSTQLIRRTKQLSDELQAPWIAAYVETPKRNFNDTEREALENQLHFAESLGATTVVLHGLKPSEEILKFAHEKNVTKIVLGKPSHSIFKDLIFGSFVGDIIRGSGDIDIYAISGRQEKIHSKEIKKEISWAPYIFSIALITGWTAFIKKFIPDIEIVNLAMTYLLLNLVVAVRYGQGPSLVASFLSVACFDFFFVPPFNTFAVSDGKYIVTFLSMFTVTLLTSRLMIRLRRSAEAASARERYTSDLYSLSREMTTGSHTSDIVTRDIVKNVIHKLSDVIDADVVVFLGADPELMFLEATTNLHWKFSPTDHAVSQWVCKNGKVAGLGTQTLPSAKTTFFPLIASRGILGVVGLHPHTNPELSLSNFHFVESVIGQLSLTLERAMLSEEALEAEKEAEREGFMSTLLSSVSHDLRTPLTSIAGAASTLLTQEEKLSSNDHKKLLEMIGDESNHLNRLVSNILQMTKIDSGHINARKELHSLEEIIGSALDRLDSLLGSRMIQAEISETLPMVPMDDLLIEQVLTNLIENALRYTPEGSPIDIRVFQEGKSVTVEILDRGPGIPDCDKRKIFEKYFRSGHQKALQDVLGTGLGLAICAGIIKAHQGHIGVKDRDGGGSIFYFSLPL